MIVTGITGAMWSQVSASQRKVAKAVAKAKAEAKEMTVTLRVRAMNSAPTAYVIRARVIA